MAALLLLRENVAGTGPQVQMRAVEVGFVAGNKMICVNLCCLADIGCGRSQSINQYSFIPRHDQMQANKLKNKHDQKNRS